ncbi:uncharacterized protein ACNLHF_024151 isoform 2-T2 [Anomaloglossus baeobatrachus]
MDMSVSSSDLKPFLSVTHTEKDPNDITKALTNKDIHRLKKQYYSLKNGLKMQAIVFETGARGGLYTSRNVTPVQVNEIARTQAAFSNQIHTKEVSLGLQHKEYLMGRDGVWHAHLDIHRMTLLDQHRTPKTDTTQHRKNIQRNPSPSPAPFPSSKTTSKNLPYHLLPQKKKQLKSEAARKLGLYGLH